ncbi:MAG: TetR family transcriptional regulator [Candidatus Latescibacteria bacterium]|nr:TetR family transcriptional regulator [Candidatus Latescibacterota bacterium]
MALQTPNAKRESEVDQVRERLLQAANELFYKEGVQAVGIDRILRHAGAAKASLYTHFQSKDELVAAYLDRRGAQWRQQVLEELEKKGGSPRQRLLLLFDLLATWTCSREFRGCPFINITGELSAPDHPAHAVTRRYRDWLRKLVGRLVAETGLEEVEQTTQSIVILYDGALSGALVDSNREAAAAARWTLEKLLPSQ